MTETKHTPGPWMADGHDSGYTEHASHEVCSEFWTVALVLSDAPELAVSSAANARLIAAAPDLLQALYPFAGMSFEGTVFALMEDAQAVLLHHQTGHEVTIADFKRAVAAIAKATQ